MSQATDGPGAFPPWPSMCGLLHCTALFLFKHISYFPGKATKIRIDLEILEP
jgi:hypothetical protein